MITQLTRWMQCWLDQDAAPLEAIFAPDAVYTECYGPEYVGHEQLKRWFREWNLRGRVLRWDVKRSWVCGATLVAEWYFLCEYDGVTDGFDGVTLADFDSAGRISCLREFQSKPEHIHPYDGCQGKE